MTDTETTFKRSEEKKAPTALTAPTPLGSPLPTPDLERPRQAGRSASNAVPRPDRTPKLQSCTAVRTQPQAHSSIARPLAYSTTPEFFLEDTQHI